MTIKNPFIFGKAAEGNFFTDRQEDARRLKANLTHGISTVLMSPRRWGKTSLVKRVIEEIEFKEIIAVYIDVFPCKSEYDFYRTFASGVIRQTSGRLDEWVEAAKAFLGNLSPKFSFGPDPMTDFSLQFDWNPKDDVEAILSLPEKIAVKKGVQVVVCIDEFQQVAEFPDMESFQKKLRGVWQHQQHVTYCMFGSKKHLMEKIFNEKSKPFYKFGDMMPLKKIPTDEWVPFLCTKFRDTGKVLAEAQAARICELTENVSSYVQHLAWLVWYKSDKQVRDEDLGCALSDLLEQNKVFFQREMEQLTELQMNFLKALANGVTKGFSRKEVIRKYRLESTANVQSVKKSLIKKDLIYIDEGSVRFDDPLFRHWIKRQAWE